MCSCCCPAWELRKLRAKLGKVFGIVRFDCVDRRKCVACLPVLPLCCEILGGSFMVRNVGVSWIYHGVSFV